MDLQKLVDDFGKQMQMERMGNMMTLGELIISLKSFDANMPIILEEGKSIGKADSYRGYYSDLAFEPINEESTVGTVLAESENVLDQTLTGYKGGEFVMNKSVPVWVARYGSESGIQIIGLTEQNGKVIILTKKEYS